MTENNNPSNLPPYSSAESASTEETRVEGPPPPYQAFSCDTQATFPLQPPPNYNLPPPSYSSSNYASSNNGRNSGFVFVDSLHPIDNEEEPERENSSTVLLYTLAVLTCVVCGFFAGLLFIILIFLGEKRSTVPMSKRRKYYLFVSLVISAVSFFFVFLVISWFGYYLKPMPFGYCRYGVSFNKTCCAPILPERMCSGGIIKLNADGCKICCMGEDCQDQWRSNNCPICKEFSKKQDLRGCKLCCKMPDCGDRGTFINQDNCSECCPAINSTSCQETTDLLKAHSCPQCCPKCLSSTHRTDSRGCVICCPPISCHDTYTDEEGCKKCCRDSKSCHNNATVTAA